MQEMKGESPAHNAYVELATMSRWYVVSRAIHTVAQLGLANYMSDTPISVQELAKASHTQPELLDRLLNFLTNYKLFEKQNGGYTLTPLSKPLRDDDPYSLRDVLCMVDENWWQAFSKLDVCLQSGKSGFFEQHGDDFFTFLSKFPERQKNFDRGMAKISTFDDEAIACAYDFNQFSSLSDLGAGRGGLVRAIAHDYPALKVVLFDSESVVRQINQDDFPPNVRLQAGNFFTTIPQAEGYIFKGVLHDFNDKDMGSILKNCAKQMSNKARLLIAEQVMPDNEGPHPNKTMDIVMMVLLGGRQRTLKEWQGCIEPMGLKFQKSYPTKSIFTLMEFARA